MRGKQFALLADNAAIHRSPLVNHMARITGTQMFYPPAYYPQGCAVELVLAILKRTISGFIIDNKTDLINCIYLVLSTLPSGYFASIFEHAHTVTLKDASLV